MSLDLYILVLSIIPMVFAITVHEYAHGWVAKKYGDNTAYLAGRLTLNPINHIDILGTIIVPFLMYITTGFMFGWAKPVPVNWNNLRNYSTDGIKVALAGPISNLIMALVWGFIIIAFNILDKTIHLPLIEGMIQMGMLGISFNIALGVFNLLPIPPLDGGRVLYFLSPYEIRNKIEAIEPYGFFIIMGLSIVGVLNLMVYPIVNVLTLHLVDILKFVLQIVNG